MACCSVPEYEVNHRNNPSNEMIHRPITIEGFENSIELLLAYTGKNIGDVRRTSRSYIDASISDGQRNILDLKQQCHGISVLRYLGKCHGLCGADPFEDLEIDQIVEVFSDFRTKLLSVNSEKDSSLRSNKSKDFTRNEAMVYLKKFDAIVATNRGHLALNKLTWADFLVVGMWDQIKTILNPDLDDTFSNIKAMVDNICTITFSKRK